MMVKINKKAALELSVSAIVVIIIAIVMLALGLGFVRMLFGGATTKFAALIEQEAEPPTPSTGNVVTLSRGLVMTSPKSAEVIKISVYNPTGYAWDGGSCGGTATYCTQSPVKDSQTSCLAQNGCSWTTYCTGSATDCTSSTVSETQGSCLAQDGCSWTAGTAGLTPGISCIGGLSSVAFTTNSKIIDQGKYETYDALFEIPATTPQDTSYLCEIEIGGYSKDFTIRVQ